jgi:hypothetical protein
MQWFSRYAKDEWEDQVTDNLFINKDGQVECRICGEVCGTINKGILAFMIAHDKVSHESKILD